MLDIGKLIHIAIVLINGDGFSSMLDIGKLIQRELDTPTYTSFSSMLDIGKLILKYRSGIVQIFAVARSI